MVDLNNGLVAVGLGSTSNNLALVNANDWMIQSFLNGHTSDVDSLVLLSDGRLVSGSADKTVIIWKT